MNTFIFLIFLLSSASAFLTPKLGLNSPSTSTFVTHDAGPKKVPVLIQSDQRFDISMNMFIIDPLFSTLVFGATTCVAMMVQKERVNKAIDYPFEEVVETKFELEVQDIVREEVQEEVQEEVPKEDAAIKKESLVEDSESSKKVETEGAPPRDIDDTVKETMESMITEFENSPKPPVQVRPPTLKSPKIDEMKKKVASTLQKELAMKQRLDKSKAAINNAASGKKADNPVEIVKKEKPKQSLVDEEEPKPKKKSSRFKRIFTKIVNPWKKYSQIP